VYSAISSIPFSSRSGGTDGRPIPAYISSNNGDMSASTVSAFFLIPRKGWSAGTRNSGDNRHNIDDCFASAPRIVAI
jgi:hypothetical protein